MTLQYGEVRDGAREMWRAMKLGLWFLVPVGIYILRTLGRTR